MENYCTDNTNCRRQIFCDKFTEHAKGFVRCKSKCDNCKALNGEPRRNYGSIPLQPKRLHHSSRPDTVSLVDDDIPSTVEQPKFIKASALHSVNSNSSTHTHILHGTVKGGTTSRFQSAMTFLRPAPAIKHVIDLVQDDEKSDAEWFEPLQKRSKK